MALDWVQGCVARICLGVCSVECCPVHCVLPAIASSESVSKVRTCVEGIVFGRLSWAMHYLSALSQLLVAGSCMFAVHIMQGSRAGVWVLDPQ